MNEMKCATSERQVRIASLNARMQELASVMRDSGDCLALLGLGSAGVESDRLDEWSDLDFFAIVRPGMKQRYIADTAWLAAPCSLDWIFRNTVDGYKLLWKDGIFAEMAVFEPSELAAIPFAPGRVVWSASGFDTACIAPANNSGRLHDPGTMEHLQGELLSCLYVGLCRFRRGEKLSAWRFIQGYCLDRFLEITEQRDSASAGHRDLYVRDRRFEQRYPSAAELLSGFLAGYDQTPAVALRMLAWLESITPVNPGMKRRIQDLAEGSQECYR